MRELFDTAGQLPGEAEGAAVEDAALDGAGMHRRRRVDRAARIVPAGRTEYRGGGAIEVVTGDDVLWADAPDRDEAGSPNVIALAVAARALSELDHGLVAAILSYEGGIGVRSGCFCAQQYVAWLLGLTPADEERRCCARRAGLPWPKPGMVRASFGLYNTFEEVDLLVDMLHRIACGDHRGTYESRLNGAEYVPTRAI